VDDVMKVVKERINGLSQGNISLSILYNLSVGKEKNDPSIGFILPPLHEQIDIAHQSIINKG
jgi:hypothetical protein